jgi:hypothetical protein
MRLRLVSGFLADSIQQIHSLRASGVISPHVTSASESSFSASSRSSGRSWATPPGMLLLSVIRGSELCLCEWPVFEYDNAGPQARPAPMIEFLTPEIHKKYLWAMQGIWKAGSHCLDGGR